MNEANGGDGEADAGTASLQRQEGATVLAATPACRYFGTCGGCQNQHLAHSQQLENKRKRLSYLLQPYFTGELSVHHGEPYGYRSRMDFIIAPRVIGFREQDERKLVDITECPISEPRLNHLLTDARAWLTTGAGVKVERFERALRRGVLKYVVARTADDTCVSFVLNEDSPKLGEAVDAIKAYAEHSAADNVVIAYVPAQSDDSVSLESFAVKGSEFLQSTFLGKRLHYHSQAFFQNNTRMAEAMVQHVQKHVQALRGNVRTLVDAYGGVGTFGIVLAADCARVISIESHPLGTEACAKNAQANSITNLMAVNEDAGNLKKLDIPTDAIVLLDPPRSGLGDKMLRYLLERKPQDIIYVSCNPSQLAKELAQLARHYTLTDAALFDLFPQTNHMEAVIVLKKK